MEFLARFDYAIEYIQGVRNKVADCLYRYYESDEEGEMHHYDEYVSADVRLDPEGEDLPLNRLREYQQSRVGPSSAD